jgi:hypothetical protein
MSVKKYGNWLSWHKLKNYAGLFQEELKAMTYVMTACVMDEI